MRKRKIHRKYRLAGRIFYWCLVAVTLAVGGILKTDPAWIAKNALWLKPAFEWVVGTSPIVLPGATMAVAFMSSVRCRIVPVKIDSAVKALLDEFRRRALPENDAELTHRVTLFRHHSWYTPLLFRGEKPWAGCLVPYERAGEYALSSGACFLASKDKPEKSEGFAGLVFKNRRCEYISSLPNLNQRGIKATIKKYAQETCMSVEKINQMIKQSYSFPESFWGTPVEVDGKLWGVLVIDSHAAQLPDGLKEAFNPVGSCLGKLLSTRD